MEEGELENSDFVRASPRRAVPLIHTLPFSGASPAGYDGIGSPTLPGFRQLVSVEV